MKLFILASLAISVGFSESSDSNANADQTPPHHIVVRLSKQFHIEAVDWKPCKVTDYNAWTNNVVNALNAIADANSNSKHKKLSVSEFKQLVVHVIKAAVPCAKAKYVREKTDNYMANREAPHH
ncbi:uncharacterized protein LOC117175260 [Belonocnema kinseyi]|uniref:uncharacterized protein LOC117175260 n=1 Tax=Belonocnema kinseyi TaxID=2817044 RepID=UPI00143D1377|nr:uncharacterized protein LOC117175260 [Belonocnema kinseyi]